MKGVLFDLDRTLLDRDTALLNYAKNVWVSRKSKTEEGVERFTARFIEIDARGRGDKRITFEVLVSEFFRDCTPGELQEHFDRNFPRFVLPFEDTVSLLNSLRSDGLRVGVVSNGRSEFQRAKLVGTGILPLLDVVVISEEIGCKKPDPRMFQAALDALCCRPEEAMFVGDSEEADIRGSQAVHMHAILRRYSGEIFPTQALHEVLALGEILSIVRNARKKPNKAPDPTRGARGSS